MKTIQNTFKELLRYPSAIFGLVIILALIGLSIYAMVTIPYHEALRLNGRTLSDAANCRQPSS
jgi:peptide/nickel transport system permease protein